MEQPDICKEKGFLQVIKEFAKLRAFVPSCLTPIRALRALRALFTRDIKSLIKSNFKHIYDGYIYIYMYIIIIIIHIHIKVNYAINRIYEKTFRSDLSTQKTPLL